MSKDELIVKQQLEIESLKETVLECKSIFAEASHYLIYVQQWSIDADEFPRVAMSGVVKACNQLNSLEIECE